MAYIGKTPTSAPLTASDITNDIINADKIADNSISEEHLDPTVITGLSALGAEPADTDEFLISDAGTLKRMDYSYIKGGGGFTRVGGASATGVNVGDVSFDVFSATYNLYYVQYRINMIADSSQVWMRVRNSSGYKTNAGYFFAFSGNNHSNTTSNFAQTSESKFQLSGGTTSNDGHNSCIGHMMFYMPYSSSHVTDVVISAQETDESYVTTARHGGGSHQVAETHVGFGFLGNNQNIEQYDVQIYGLNQS